MYPNFVDILPLHCNVNSCNCACMLFCYVGSAVCKCLQFQVYLFCYI